MTPNTSQQVLASVGRASGLNKPGFPLLDSTGRHIGQIDRITVAHGRLCVEGWALTGLVGLASGDQKFEREPHLAREDVLLYLGDTEVQTPGFSLDIPVSLNHVVFWTEVGGIRYVYPLPRITMDDLQIAENA